MVSYFCLVDSYIQLADFNKAYEQFLHCFDFIAQTNKPSNKTPAFDRSIMLAANKLRVEWLQFQKYHHEEFSQQNSLSIDEFQTTITSFLDINHTVH